VSKSPILPSFCALALTNCHVFPDDVMLPKSGTGAQLATDGGEPATAIDGGEPATATDAGNRSALSSDAAAPGPDAGFGRGSDGGPEIPDGTTVDPLECRLVHTEVVLADAWLDATQQGRMKGEFVDLAVGAVDAHRSLVRFSIAKNPALDALDYTNVELELTLSLVAGRGRISLHRVTLDWLEDRVSWNRAQEGAPYDWVGGQFDQAARAEAEIWENAVAGDLVRWDVTELVRDELAGAESFGWILKDVAGGGLDAGQFVLFWAREAGTVTAPRLLFSDCTSP
jgi:hypothetical protein